MKISRQSKIIELVDNYDIETQEELANHLLEAGYNVTQATVSRDIRELKLTKAAVGGKQKYIALQSSEPGLNEKYVRVLKEGFISMEMAQNILVVKTVSGMAMAVAAALDALDLKNFVGCIAGDDTVLCAIRTVEDTIPVMERINKIINSNNSEVI